MYANYIHLPVKHFKNQSMSNSIRSFILILCCICASVVQMAAKETGKTVTVGAERFDILLPLLQNKRVALLVNQTSTVGKNQTHLLDALIAKGVDVVCVFAPEHGFRGNADAGELVKNGKDSKTGVDIVSIYGKNKKPSAETMQKIDAVVFDIQDVGARFYTYISSMHYVMEACAENNKDFIVLDRPNPCDYIDGPILEPAYKSFVGMHPIPVLHGLTVGELAQMINGEKWLKSQPATCKLTVVPMQGWEHGQAYSLPIKPSPNLPNDQSIALYPSLCLFEATKVSIGRGTYFPFQVIGFPSSKYGSFKFTPVALEGFDKNPLQKDKVCYGVDLREVTPPTGFSLQYFIDFYNKSGQKELFFDRPKWFDLLTGTSKLRQAIVAGKSEQQIKSEWQPALQRYKQMRSQYLLYPDNRN